MSYKPYVRIRLSPDEPVTTKHINLVQDNVQQALSQVLGKDVLDRVLVGPVQLQPRVVNYVSHTLGRPIQGYNVTMRNAEMTVWVATGVNNSPALQILLATNATGIVSMECF